ncbi:MAG: DUF1553 domain-containing protein [Planctomycetales bacterium]
MFKSLKPLCRTSAGHLLRIAFGMALVGWVLAAGNPTSIAGGAPPLPHPAARVSFARDIRPILSHHCGTCHGADEATREAGLRLDVRESAVKPRQKGAAAIVPGHPEASLILARIDSDDESLRMPPAEFKKPLTAQQRELLSAWIAQGADYSQHWAYAPPSRPIPPRQIAGGRVRNAIDQFVQARLADEGLKPAPEASRETLLRRVTLDLTGLPPTLEELDAFLADESPDAYDRAVERLFQSPHYAERMAMHWLDVARYADTNGYNNDEERTMWPWRDWVIDAFRRQLPYDQFLIEQLAGDLLPEATLDQRVATGFNRNHVLTTEGGIIEEEYRVEYVADRVHTTATVFMGLSLQCARCHDHKYDPFSQREYYQLFAYFNSQPDRGVNYDKGGFAPPFVKVPSAAQQAERAQIERRSDELTRALQQRTDQGDSLAAAWEMELTAADRQALAAAGPLVHLPFDEATGALAADRADPSRMGAISGTPTWTEGKLGGALEFDGQSHVDLGQAGAFEASDHFSIAAWVYPTSAEPSTIASKMDEAAGHRGYDLILEGGRVACHLIDQWPNNGLKVITREPLKMQTWQHVMLTYDGSRKAAGVKIYVDGRPQPQEVASDQLSGSLRTEKPFHVGRRQAAAPFRGRLDDLQIYGLELGEEEARRLAAGEPVRRMADLLAIAPADRTDAQRAEIRDYYLSRVDPELKRLKSALADVPSRRAALEKSIPGVMVMEEPPEPRRTQILKRGQYDAPGEEVVAGVPVALPGLPSGAPANRLGLAQWLTQRSHPLTARVAVNRWWELFFGAGLVETAEDFGVTGALPTHPELLDWLACELLDSGWNIQRIQKLIVTSATYRQSSQLSAELRERDPRNQLLARGPRFRLSAETVRDNALAVAGLLVDRIGGPSVKPYQPEGLWEDVSVERREKYVVDPGEGLYRRAMYTFWKRTCPPPSMSSFDAPTRETCTIRRARTNTPLQALVLLNDPTYVEAARKLAERAGQSADPSPAGRLSYIVRLALARHPTPEEQTTLLDLWERGAAHFRSDREAASRLLAVGRSSVVSTLDTAELAAWTLVCSTLMNMDEAISKD